MVPFAIRILEEVQLHPDFTLHLEDPIQSIPWPWNQPFWVGKQHGFIFVHKDKVAIRTTVDQGPHYLLLTVLVTALAGVTILRITPHHSYYCCSSTFRWIGSSRGAVIDMYILAFAWWRQHDIISIAKCWRIAKCCWIARHCQIAQCRGIAREGWIAKSCWIAKYPRIVKDCWLTKCCWIAKYCRFAKDLWIAKCRWTSDVLIARNLQIANNIAIASWFRGGSFNWTRGSKLRPFNGFL